MAVLPDGRVVSRSWDETLRIWNTSSGECEMDIACESAEAQRYNGHLNRSPESVPDGVIPPYVDGALDIVVISPTPNVYCCSSGPKVHIFEIVR